jgi:hypothetical protein
MNALPKLPNLPLRIFALCLITAGAAVAWFILGGSLIARTENADSELRRKVEGLWGAEQRQGAPALVFSSQRTDVVADERGEMKPVTISQTRRVAPASSHISAELEVEHRRKGLLWYNTYKVRFAGTYAFETPPPGVTAHVFFPFPAKQAIYDDFSFRVNGASASPATGDGGWTFPVPLEDGPLTLEVSYLSQGLDDWSYAFAENGVSEVRDFSMDIQTHFDGFDFPEGTLSPTSKEKKGEGWLLRWSYKNLMAGAHIGVRVPQKINPGPIASRITFFAPVCLVFFFFTIFMISLLRGIPLHPMNYLFLAAAFFAFHLLFAYLVDHVDIHAAFAASSAVSLFLVASYLRLVVGPRFALREAGLTQLLYLVLFSYAFFWEGYTGLTITIGSILTLFVMMQLTGRVDWNEKFSGEKTAPPSSS